MQYENKEQERCEICGMLLYNPIYLYSSKGKRPYCINCWVRMADKAVMEMEEYK